jgi:large subunit ribosomal protein L27
MAHVKAGGVAKGNKDSVSKRLGMKVYGGQMASPGSILVRQKGTRVYPGTGVQMGKDFTLFAVLKGKVQYFIKAGKQFVSVLS